LCLHTTCVTLFLLVNNKKENKNMTDTQTYKQLSLNAQLNTQVNNMNNLVKQLDSFKLTVVKQADVAVTADVDTTDDWNF
jgi:hypothetical protein